MKEQPTSLKCEFLVEGKCTNKQPVECSFDVLMNCEATTIIIRDLAKIHIYLCHLIQHHLTPEIKTELKEFIKSWLLMMEE